MIVTIALIYQSWILLLEFFEVESETTNDSFHYGWIFSQSVNRLIVWFGIIPEGTARRNLLTYEAGAFKLLLTACLFRRRVWWVLLSQQRLHILTLLLIHFCQMALFPLYSVLFSLCSVVRCCHKQNRCLSVMFPYKLTEGGNWQF